MRPQLPPFHAVRAFEASARLLSFRRAAEELCLTQSAISHQVKSLEDFLGVQLFHRETRGVTLTGAGTTYLRGVSGILDRMADETARISNGECSGRLTVRVAPGFTRWLVPRLAGFHMAYPGIDLELSSSLAIADFSCEDIDINVRWGFEPRQDHSVTPLAASTRYPVANPLLLRKYPPIEKPADLLRMVLLHEAGCNNFEKWFDFAEPGVRPLRHGLSFSNYDTLLQACIEGQGVALGYDIIVAGDVAAGRLLRLFEVDYPPRILYSVVTPIAWEHRPRIQAFRGWLLNELVELPHAHMLPPLLAAHDVAQNIKP